MQRRLAALVRLSSLSRSTAAMTASVAAVRACTRYNSSSSSRVNASGGGRHAATASSPAAAAHATTTTTAAECVQRGPAKDRYPPMTVDLSDPRRRIAVLVDGSNATLLQSSRGNSDGDGDDKRSDATAQSLLRDSVLYTTVLPAVLTVGVPVLLRVFAHELSGEWQRLLAGSADEVTAAAAAAGGDGKGGSAAVPPLPGRIGKTMLSLPSTAAHDNSNSSDKATTRASREGGAAGGAAPMLQAEYFRVERFIPISMQMEADAQHVYDFCAQNKIEGVCYVCNEAERGVFVRIMQRQLYGEEDGDDDGDEGSSGRGAQTDGSTCSSSSSTTASTQHDVDTPAFFSQYLCDETGMVRVLTVDGRTGNGA